MDLRDEMKTVPQGCLRSVNQRYRRGEHLALSEGALFLGEENRICRNFSSWVPQPTKWGGGGANSISRETHNPWSAGDNWVVQGGN